MAWRQIDPGVKTTIRRMLQEGARVGAIRAATGVSQMAVATQRKQLEQENAAATTSAAPAEKLPADRESLLARYRALSAQLDYVMDEEQENVLRKKRDEVAKALGRINAERMAVQAAPLRSNSTDPHILPPAAESSETDEEREETQELQEENEMAKELCSRCREKPVIARGMCHTCWGRAKRAGEFTPCPPGTRKADDATQPRQRRKRNTGPPPPPPEPAEGGGQRGYRVHINGCVVECGTVTDVLALVGAKT